MHTQSVGPASSEIESGSAAEGPSPWPGRLTLVAPAVIALVAGFWGLARGSMWNDEATSYIVAARALPDLWRTLGHIDAVHGFYYLLLHPLASITSDPATNEILLRLPSVLATGVAAAGVAAIAQRTASLRAGLFSGLAYATTPVVSFYAQEARSYALVSAAVVLSTLLLVEASRRTERRWWVLYALATALACLLNLFAGLVLVAHATTLVLTRQRAAVLRRWALACLAVAVAIAPLAWICSRQTQQVAWLPKPHWETVQELITRFAGSGVLLVLILALALAAFLPKRLTGKPRIGHHAVPTATVGTDRRIALPAVAAPLAVLPPSLLLLVSQVKPFYQDRYILYAICGIALLTGAGLHNLAGVLERSRALRPLSVLAASALLLATAALALPAQKEVRRTDSRNDDIAAAARVIHDNAHSGDAVLFLPSGGRIVAETYPKDFADVRDIALMRSGAEVGRLSAKEQPADQIITTLEHMPRVWVIRRSHLTDSRFTAPQDRAKLSTLHDHYQQAEAIRVHGYLIRLFVRKPTS
ncbi:mannosyltransferase [Planotetraspora thailandica]|uniref:Mannosyltransferase n=1 Tax=Planotetraspora thailandica TaxID=487172 RepID=A0A8J4DEZ9_9ACTN|nr:glycosyltransferase family 39 protein [Planotetraspora thailandica]GII59025.1 mannosyltransferase [Planotetraspora thailandica]